MIRSVERVQRSRRTGKFLGIFVGLVVVLMLLSSTYIGPIQGRIVRDDGTALADAKVELSIGIEYPGELLFPRSRYVRSSVRSQADGTFYLTRRLVWSVPLLEHLYFKRTGTLPVTISHPLCLTTKRDLAPGDAGTLYLSDVSAALARRGNRTLDAKKVRLFFSEFRSSCDDYGDDLLGLCEKLDAFGKSADPSEEQFLHWFRREKNVCPCHGRSATPKA